jgi:hypothetical protein
MPTLMVRKTTGPVPAVDGCGPEFLKEAAQG